MPTSIRTGYTPGCIGRIEGSFAIGGTKASTDGAHLRWFITSVVVKGLGAARQLYESHQFRLVHESPGQEWGKVVTEQEFVRENGLRSARSKRNELLNQ